MKLSPLATRQGVKGHEGQECSVTPRRSALDGEDKPQLQKKWKQNALATTTSRHTHRIRDNGLIHHGDTSGSAGCFGASLGVVPVLFN